MRVILYTGKGGVGKTSVSAATGVYLAKQGLRTLVISTDAAHSLSDSFDIELGHDPVMIADRLWGVEVDSLKETERSWGAVQKWFRGIVEWANLKDIASEEMVVFPGMEELFCLLKIKQYVKEQQYDAIIVDCAPTGETLRLLSFPTLLQWWIKKIFPHERRLVKVIRPVAKVVTGGMELPDEETMNTIGHLATELEEMHRILFNPEITSVRIVVNPEKMVIAEARRSLTYLNLYGFNTDAVIVNKIWPQNQELGYFQAWADMQTKYIQEINDCFAPIPILSVPMMQTEVTGKEALKQVGIEAYSGIDPYDILYKGQIEEVQKDEEGYLLIVALPFIQKSDIDLMQRGDELTINVGYSRRKIHLPRILMGRPITSSRFVDQQLFIRFAERE